MSPCRLRGCPDSRRANPQIDIGSDPEGLDRGALDLRAVHDAARSGIEGIAAVERAAVVPQDEVVALPHLAKRELRLGRMRPEAVQGGLAFVAVQPDDVG